MKKRLVLIVSHLLVALIFSFLGYFRYFINYTQTIRVNDVSFATIGNELSEENNIIKLNTSEAKEIIKRLRTKKDNKYTLEMVFPIRIRFIRLLQQLIIMIKLFRKYAQDKNLTLQMRNLLHLLSR